MNIPYQMRTENSCGPDAMACATSIDHDAVDRAWGIDDIGKFKNIADTPWNHFAALKKLNIPWTIRTCGDIQAGRCANQKTVILVHSTDHPLLAQHWVVLNAVYPDGTVSLHWGDGSLKVYGPESFRRLYSGGKNVGPQCAYEVGIGSTSLSWYQRLYAWVTGKFV